MLDLLGIILVLLTGRPATPDLNGIIAGAARAQQLNPHVLRALLETESRLNPHARSRHGVGIAGFTPAGVAGVNFLRTRAGRSDRFTLAAAMEPGLAVPAAAELLAYFRRFCGSLEAGLAGYNGGYAHCKAVARHGARGARQRGLLDRSGRVKMSGRYVEWVLRRARELGYRAASGAMAAYGK